jgi:hypothetical protein
MPKRDYTFDVEYLLKHMSWFLRLPLLEDMDVLIDTHSLQSLIPPRIDKRLPVHGYCPRHKEYISESPVLQQLAISLDRFDDYLFEVLDLWDSEAPGLPDGGQLHFRFHMTQQALLRTHDMITRKHPSLRVRGNNSLAPCHAHSVLGSCELVTCRMLHAIEEDSTYHELVQDMRYHFIRAPDHYGPEGIPASPTWTEEGLEMPRVISLVDLKEGMSINTPPPSVEAEDMFDMFYSRRTDPAQAGTPSTEGLEAEAMHHTRTAPFNMFVLSLLQVTSSGVMGKSAIGQRQLGIGNRTTLAPSCPWLEATEISIV